LRHLPRRQPPTCPQAVQYVKPCRRFPRPCFSLRPRFCQLSEQLQPPATHSRYSVMFRGVWGPPNFTARTISRRGCWHGRRGISPNYDDTCHPRRGGSPSEEPGTLRFCDARLLDIDKTRVCRTETVASPRRIRKAHRAPSTRGAFPCAAPLPLLSLIWLLRPRPAPAT
jgi:hypothetical protein